MSGTPSKSMATVRPDLAAFMEFDLEQDRKGFIGLKVAVPVEVDEQADTFPKVKLESLLQNAETRRSNDGSYNRTNWEFTDDSYKTEENGLEDKVDDRRAKIFRHFFNMQMISARRTRDIVLRNQEKRIAALIFNTGTWTGASLTTAVGTPWSTFATADPEGDVDAAVRKVWDGTGLKPNALVISWKKFRDIRRCVKIRDTLSASGAGQEIKATAITPRVLAQVFDLDHVIVAGSAKNAANEGQARSISNIWADNMAMVCRVAETGNIDEPCVARTFHWGEDGSAIGTAYETYYDEARRGEIVRNRHDTQEKVMYKELGHLLASV